jgi:hypothetical protein
MASNDYRFVTRWRVRATPEEVSDILGDPLALPRWWPAVYLAVSEAQPGDADGVGRVVELHTRGWLPYTLRWSFRVVSASRPHGFALEAWGDFEGSGVWSFRPDGEWTDVEFVWLIRAEKPLLRRLSFLMKPAFEANHRWAMERGRESLERELVRRRAATPAPAGS